jgi:NAD(P)-dependent dehydrogenase (short-subunit alcohol dehydrogenase family)
MKRRAVVTGGGSGLGLALVARLAADGAAVLGVDVNADTRGRVEAAGGGFVLGDVTRPGDWAEVLEVVARDLGGLDLLVLNAAVPVFEPDVVAAPYERVQRAYSVNVEGVVHGIRLAVPAMESSGGGEVVVVASLAAVMAYPDDPYYAMTKHAVLGLARSAAPGLLARGIRVTIFCPGVVDTPLVPEDVRAAVTGAGLELLSPADAADHLLEAAAADGTGRVWLSQAHLGLVEYIPPRIELPRPIAEKT